MSYLHHHDQAERLAGLLGLSPQPLDENERAEAAALSAALAPWRETDEPDTRYGRHRGPLTDEDRDYNRRWSRWWQTLSERQRIAHDMRTPGRVGMSRRMRYCAAALREIAEGGADLPPALQAYIDGFCRQARQRPGMADALDRLHRRRGSDGVLLALAAALDDMAARMDTHGYVIQHDGTRRLTDYAIAARDDLDHIEAALDLRDPPGVNNGSGWWHNPPVFDEDMALLDAAAIPAPTICL